MDVITQPARNWVDMLLYFRDRRSVTQEELGIDIDALLPIIQDKYCHVEISGSPPIYTFWNIKDWQASEKRLKESREASIKRIMIYEEAKAAKLKCLEAIKIKLGLDGAMAETILAQAKNSPELASLIGINPEDIETIIATKI